MQDTKDFDYFSLIEDNVSLTHREIRRATHKATLNKTSRYINYTNKVMRKLVNNVSKQIYSLFKRCLQKKIQSTQFKSTITIILRKSSKKDYFDARTYKLIALFDTLSKILKFIISKRLRSVVQVCDTILNIQIKACKHKSTNTILQLIIKKIHTI